MKKGVKGILCSLALLSIIAAGIVGFGFADNAIQYGKLVKKINQVAEDKKIDLDDNDYHIRFLSQNDYFIAKDELSKRIQSALSVKGWILDSKDSIDCRENSIIYKGNIEGDYHLCENGLTLNAEYWSPYKNIYPYYKKLSFNQDGSQKRDYIPKTKDYLEQVKLTVEEAIKEVLTEEEKVKYTDINITIVSEPDFDKFIPSDYRLYSNAKEYFQKKTVRYFFLLIMYLLVLIAFMLETKGKLYIVKWVLSALSFIMLVFLARRQIVILFSIGISVIVIYYSLKILTNNHFSRTLLFVFLGIILGELFTALFVGLEINKLTLDFIIHSPERLSLWISNLIICLMLVLDNKVLIEQHIERVQSK